MTTITPDQLFKFIGRKDVYAIQLKSGAYKPVHKPVTKDLLTNHLNGEITIGTYVIREDGKINWACIDIDGEAKKLPSFLTLSKIIIKLFPEFERCLEFSGRRGYHIWIFPDKPERPAFLRELIKTRLRKKGFKNIEIYPKQDSTAGLEKGLGNLIKIPEGIHLKSGKRSEILEWRNKK